MARALTPDEVPADVLRAAERAAARGESTIRVGPNALVSGPREPAPIGQASLFDPGTVARARGGSARARLGAALEREVSDDCRHYDRAGVASLYHHEPPKVLTPKGWRRMRTPEDERRVDFSGLVHDRCYVEFDLKRCSASSYRHHPEQAHQLRRLLRLSRLNRTLPVRAFLLVVDDEELQVAYVVEGAAVLERLLGGEAVALRRLKCALGSRKARYGDYEHLFAHCRRTPGVLVPEDVIVWDFLSALLQTAAPARPGA